MPWPTIVSQAEAVRLVVQHTTNICSLFGCSARLSRLYGSDASEVGTVDSPPHRLKLAPSSIGYPNWGWYVRPLRATLPLLRGRSGLGMFVAFEHGVMYVLSFATMITVVATAVALAVLLVMIVSRSVWRLFG